MTSWRPAGPRHADRVSPRHIGTYVEAPRWAGLPLPRSRVLLPHLPGSSSAPVSPPFAVRSGGRANPVGLLPSGQHPDPPRHPVGEGHRDHLLRLAFQHPFQCASHALFSIPPGGEDDLRHSYGTVSGRTEIPKPRLLLNRGGAWFRSGAVEIHLGVERECRPAGTAHPAIQMEDVDAAATRLVSFGPTSSGRERSRTSVAPRSRSRRQSPGIRAAGATGRRRLPALTGARSGSRGHRWATAARPARRLISSVKQTAGRDPAPCD